MFQVNICDIFYSAYLKEYSLIISNSLKIFSFVIFAIQQTWLKIKVLS